MVKPWKEFRVEITRLYIDEGLTLRDVQRIMRERHGFQASVRAYRQHFDQWKLHKYNCKKRQYRRPTKVRISKSAAPAIVESPSWGSNGVDRSGQVMGVSSHSPGYPENAPPLVYDHVGFLPDQTSCHDGDMASPTPSADGYALFPRTPVFDHLTLPGPGYSKLFSDVTCCDNELAGLGVASADAFHVVYDQRDAYPSSLDALNSRDKARLGWLHDIQAPWDLWWGS